jgi:NAD(P)-dependent dehydrogenase (short-subunit alcohol dehydrogenase family)
MGIPPEAVGHVREMMAKTPLGRAGNPAEIAAAVLFLASNDSAYTTGIELIIDGGISAS